MTTITPFPLRRPPPADCRRTNGDAGRPLRSLPIGAGIYTPREAANAAEPRHCNDMASAGHAARSGRKSLEPNEQQRIASGRRIDWSRMALTREPGPQLVMPETEQVPVVGLWRRLVRPISYWLGQRRGKQTRSPPFGCTSASGGFGSVGIVPRMVSRFSARPARATYIPRPALAAAICVSWTIALVAGVVLAMEIFG